MKQFNPNLSLMENLRIKSLILLLIMLMPSSFAYSNSLKIIRQGEKISLSLSGDVMTNEEREKLFNGQLTLGQLVDNKLSSAGFNKKFAEYWARKLGITVSLDSYNLRSENNRSIYQRTRGRQAEKIVNSRKYDEISLQKKYDDAFNSEKPLELSIKNCSGVNAIYNPGWRYNQDQVTQAETDMEWGDFGKVNANFIRILKDGVEKAKSFDLPCESSEWVEGVNPWFDPEGHFEYKINKNLFKPCGLNLEKCHYSRSNYRDQSSYEMTMEPAYLISRIVMDNRPFSDVLTTSQTVVGSSYGHFLAHSGNEFNIWSKFPGGAYTDKSLAEMIPLKGDFHLVNRTEQHAGILTTPTYQLLTNGRRAKANKAYEVMLCREFKVPEGILPDPSDENPDLRKRAYCAQCHRSLEPMAAFFNRYPKTAETTIYHYDGGEVDDRGIFAGKAGKGVKEFGLIASKTEAFRECAVRRTYEFVHNREMDIKTSLGALPKYLKVLETNGLRIRDILKAMVLSEEFLNYSEEAQ